MKNILVIRQGALGDILMTVPALQALRAGWPAARITMLTAGGFAALVGRMPFIDAVLIDNRRPWWDLASQQQLAARLAVSPWDGVLDLMHKPRTRLYRLLGMVRAPRWAAVAPYGSVRDGVVRHSVDRYGDAALALGGRPVAPDYSWLADDASALQPAGPYAVIIPGCSAHRLQKRWPPEYYAVLAGRLQSAGLTVLALGTAAEAEALAEACQSGAINLGGQTSIGQLAALTRDAAIVIGNDTGPTHIAAAMGAPTLALFAAVSDARQSGPRGPRTRVLECPQLHDLRPDVVWAALAALRSA